MLTAECFKARLEKGLSFIEFNYMLLQAFDFLHLFKEENCTVQLGGDDQWSNILAGADLIRRLVPNGKAFCITSPLLVKSDGSKMGKTAKGAVWLDPNKTTPYEYFQFWRNVEDPLVVQCLKWFTLLDGEQIEELAKLEGDKINEAKLVLAYECTKLCHGEEEANKAKAATSKLFGGDTNTVDDNAPLYNVSSKLIKEGISLVDLLVTFNVFSSKGEARRMIDQGGLTLNNQKVGDINYIVNDKDFFQEGGCCLVKKGKKYFYRLKVDIF
jgi:tyrosyl-tRNA synthetase